MKILPFAITMSLLLAIPLIHNVNATTPLLSFGSLGSGPGQMDTPRGIAVDDSGNIYVTDNRNHRIDKFDSSGKYVSEFDNGTIPEGIAIYNQTIYVVDRNSSSIERFTLSGKLLTTFGSQGTNMGQLSNPERIAIDRSGNIYVADTGDVQKFNSNGVSMAQFFADSKYQCCLNVMGIAVDRSNNVYAADMEFHKIIKFSPDGATLAEFNATFSAPDISGTPQDVAVDNTGNIYVADTYGGRIVKLDSVGNPLSQLKIQGVPVGLAIKGDSVYIVDIANSRVDMFHASQFGNNFTNTTSTEEQNKKVEQLNKNPTAFDSGIKLAESSPQFQSMVDRYNYSFSSDFEESGPLSKGGIGLTAHGFAFELYLGPVNPGKAVKVVEVLEDPTLTKILNVTSYPAVYMGPMMPTTNSAISNALNTTIQSESDIRYPIIDMPTIMSVVQNNTEFIEKASKYDYYLLAKATLKPITQNIVNQAQEEYELFYVLYSNHNTCHWDHLLDITLNETLNVTSMKEYALENEPPGYPIPPISCPMNFVPSTMDYNQLLTIFPPSPFATVNVTFSSNSSGPILFSGTVHKLFSKYITLSVFDPKGSLIAVSQPQPEPNGTFSQFFQPFSPLWATTGNYSVSITSGPHNLVESEFHFNGVGCCMTNVPLHYTNQGAPPLQQWKSGIPANKVICKQGFQLILKKEDNSPACVKPEDILKLLARSWGLPIY